MLIERHMHGAWKKANALAEAPEQNSPFPKYMIGNAELLSLETMNVIAPFENVEERRQVRDGMRLRYEVFSEKMRWEPPNAERLESDNYDRIATHSVLYARTRDLGSNRVERHAVSYMRLLRADRWEETPGVFRPDVPLPLMKVEGVELTPELLKSVRDSSTYELSRLCVKERFKSLRIDQGGDSHIQYHRASSLHLLLVWNDVMRQSGGPRRLVGLTEPWFIKQIRAQGYEMQNLGDPVEHRGERQPFVMDIRSERNRIVSHATLQKAKELLGDVLKPSLGRINHRPSAEDRAIECLAQPMPLALRVG